MIDLDTVTGGGNTAMENLRQFFETQSINGFELEIDPDCEVRWDEPYETAFSVPEGNPKFAVVHVGIAVDDFLRLICDAHGYDRGDMETPRLDAHEPTVERVIEDIEAGTTDEIPTPVIEIKPSYEVTYNEGRSRGFGAKEAGLDTMPVWVASQEYR